MNKHSADSIVHAHVHVFAEGGRTIPFAAEHTAALHVIITGLKTTLGLTKVRLLAIQCGDMVWMFRFLETRDDIDYTGIEIAQVRHY